MQRYSAALHAAVSQLWISFTLDSLLKNCTTAGGDFRLEFMPICQSEMATWVGISPLF